MAPVFSLVLDKDLNEDLAVLYPELYKELTKVGFQKGPVGSPLIYFRAELSAIRHSLPG